MHVRLRQSTAPSVKRPETGLGRDRTATARLYRHPEAEASHDPRVPTVRVPASTALAKALALAQRPAPAVEVEAVVVD